MGCVLKLGSRLGLGCGEVRGKGGQRGLFTISHVVYGGGMSDAYAGERPIGRAVAHYHRLLSELLPALVEDAEAGEAQIVWLDEVQRHVIRDDAPNEYARAAYLLKDLGRHEHAFQELERVQREVQRLAAEQGDNADLLVTPEVRTGIKHVRLQKVDTFVSTTMTGAA